MTWMIVVIFATLAGDVYIFTDPTFETRRECMLAVIDPAKQAGYLAKLEQEYGGALPIRGINCLEADTIKEILEEAELGGKST